MQFFKRIFLLCSFLLIFIPLYAENTGDTFFITQAEIIGLKRTKESYVQNVLKDFVGIETSDTYSNEVLTKLQEQGIFSDIAVVIAVAEDGKNAVLEVTVKEKWSFLAVPFIMGSNDGVMGGFTVMDTNAFGMKNMFLATGVFSKNMQMGMFMYSKPALDAFHPGFMVNASINHNSREFTDFDDNKICEYDMMPVGFVAKLQGIIIHNLTYSVGAKYQYIKYFDDDGFDLNDDHILTANVAINLNKNEWNGIFMISSGVNLSGSIGYNFAESDGIMGELSLNANYQFPIIKRMKIDITTAGAIAFNKDNYFNLLPGKGSVASSIGYSNFIANKVASLKFMYEAAILKMKIFTLSLYATYEGLIANDYGDNFVWTMGPGIGAKLYLNQIAIPAIMGGASYDINHNRFNFVISVGMGG